MTPLWASATAALFWRMAGEEESFPRSLERGVAFALPLAVVKLPRLRIVSVEEWLERRGVHCQLAVGDRLLRGCLAAHRGVGLIFVDGADSADEVRFTLAHELAHFLLDYYLVRERSVRLVGEAVTEVLDGLRAPTREERVNAILGNAQLGLHVHLMERSVYGCPESDVDEAERRADILALELLAPVDKVRRRLAEHSAREPRRVAAEVLASEMGLPTEVAARYAAMLIPDVHTQVSFIKKLGLR